MEELEVMSSNLENSQIKARRFRVNPLMIPLEELDFSVRTFNTLKSLRINNLAEFMNLDSDKLANVSDATKNEISRMVDRFR